MKAPWRAHDERSMWCEAGTEKARAAVPAGLVLVPIRPFRGPGVVRDQNTKITPAAKPVPLRLASFTPKKPFSGLLARLVFQLPTSK